MDGLGFGVALKQYAERLSPGLAVRAGERLQGGERELRLGYREPALADQPSSEPFASGGVYVCAGPTSRRS